MRTEDDVVDFALFQIAGLRHHDHVFPKTANQALQSGFIHFDGFLCQIRRVPSQQRAIEDDVSLGHSNDRPPSAALRRIWLSTAEGK